MKDRERGRERQREKDRDDVCESRSNIIIMYELHLYLFPAIFISRCSLGVTATAADRSMGMVIKE